MAALDSALGINFPLPITEKITKDIPNEKLAPISVGDLASSMQERRAVESDGLVPRSIFAGRPRRRGRLRVAVQAGFSPRRC